eukprot:gene11143-biopygen22862
MLKPDISKKCKWEAHVLLGTKCHEHPQPQPTLNDNPQPSAARAVRRVNCHRKPIRHWSDIEGKQTSNQKVARTTSTEAAPWQQAAHTGFSNPVQCGSAFHLHSFPFFCTIPPARGSLAPSARYPRVCTPPHGHLVIWGFVLVSHDARWDH